MTDEQTPVRFRYKGPGGTEDSNTSKVKRFFLYMISNSTASEWPLLIPYVYCAVSGAFAHARADTYLSRDKIVDHAGP